jgi:hypothetical protein
LKNVETPDADILSALKGAALVSHYQAQIGWIPGAMLRSLETGILLSYA